MPRRLIAFVVLAIVLGAIFVRLGFWQLARLGERRAANRAVAAQLAMAPEPFAAVARAPDGVNRRARVEGALDYQSEFVVTGRSRNGSPGVHIMTGPIHVRAAARWTASARIPTN